MLKFYLSKPVNFLSRILSTATLFLILAGSTSQAQISLPANFQNQLMSSGWTELEGFRFDSTGQMYAWEKAGRVWVVDTNGVKLVSPLLDIHEEVGGWRDHGLNGFALDPNFRTNGYYYLFYTVDRNHLIYFNTLQYVAASDSFFKATIARVTRYTANSATNFTTTVAGSRLILLGEDKKTGVPVLHESHSGGSLVFGTDGSLLISTGDGASYNFTDSGGTAVGNQTYWQQALADTIIRDKENVGSFRSQLVDCLNGKILRIDPATGDGLPSNPFYDPANPRAAKSRVWCLGLRNPFRMCLRPGSGSTDISAGDPGDLFVGDVGWALWEDMQVAKTSGLNFGWPIYEGLAANTSYLAKLTVNKDAPNPLFGTGGCTQQFFKFKDLLIQETLNPPSFPNPCNAAQQVPGTIPTFMHSRPDVDWRHGSDTARTGIFIGNNASEIMLNHPASPVPGPVFQGNAALGGVWYSGSKFPVIYQNTYFQGDLGQGWFRNFKYDLNSDLDSVKNFGTGIGFAVFMEYNQKDEWLYYVKYPSQIHRIIYTSAVNNLPVAVASQNTLYGAAPLTVNFTGSNSSDPENLPLTYSWNFGDGSPVSTAVNPSHIFNPVPSNPVTYTVVLTVTDNIGQTSTDTLHVYVNNNPPVVNIISFNDGDLYSMSQNTILPLQANVFDAEHAPSQLFYTWQTFLHHNNHEHQEAIDTNKITTTVISNVGCNGETYYFRIQLTVTDAAGLSTIVNSNIYPACDPPDAFFTADTNKLCINGTIHFTDHSTNLPDSWQWLFPGGTPSSSSLKNPVVVYNTGGKHDVSLIATSTQGADTLLLPDMINVVYNPPATITPAGTDSVCAATPVLLTANSGSNLIYQWSKNSINISGATALTYTAITSGTFKVKVTRTTTGCNKTSIGKKIVNRQVTSVIIPQGPTTFCIGDSVVLSAPVGAGNTYEWKRNGIVISGATASNFTAKTTGLYRVILTEVHGCSKVSAGVQVTVNCRLDGSALTHPFVEEFYADIFPNPVTNNSTLSVVITMAAEINVEIYDAIGKRVKSVAENVVVEEGENLFDINTSDFTNGIYFVKINSAGYSRTIKMIVQNSW